MGRNSARKLLVGMTFACGAFMAPGLVQAATLPCVQPATTPVGSSTPGYTGLLFNTVYCGNDPNPFSGSYINGSPSLVKVGILEGVVQAGEDGAGPGNQAADLVLSGLAYSGTNVLSGTWTLAHHTGELYPTIVLIKAASGFFLQSVVAGVLSGTFSTTLLGGHGLSHISLYDGAGPGGSTPEVPLPAALPLLAAGLGGMAWLSRRRKRQLSQES